MDPIQLAENKWDTSDPLTVLIGDLPVRDATGLFPGGYNSMVFCVACETDEFLNVKLPPNPGIVPPFTPAKMPIGNLD